MNKFANRLNELINNSGKPQKQICEELGIPEPKLSKWKNNHIEPDINDLIMLAKYFKVSIDDLVGLED